MVLPNVAARENTCIDVDWLSVEKRGANIQIEIDLNTNTTMTKEANFGGKQRENIKFIQV